MSDDEDLPGPTVRPANLPALSERVVRDRPLPIGLGPPNPARDLANWQASDGSYGDVARTAAAVVALVMLGHGERHATYRSSVDRASAWLKDRTEPEAVVAREVLALADRGLIVAPTPAMRALIDAGREGAVLAGVLR
jgi:hypothetical protein